MDLSRIRDEFSIWVVGAPESEAAAVYQEMSSANYVLKSVPSFEEALVQIREDPPHLIVVSHVNDEIECFLSEVRTLSEEIKVIVVTFESEPSFTKRLLKLGAYDVIDRFQSRSSELVLRCDRAIERLVVEFQLEQTRDRVERAEILLRRDLTTFGQTHSRSVRQESKAKFSEFISEFIQKREQIRDGDELFFLVTQEVSRLYENSPTLFLKFLPSYSALMVTHQSNILKPARSLGIKFKELTYNQIVKKLQNPRKIPELGRLMEQVFSISAYDAHVVRDDDDDIGGVLVVGGDYVGFDEPSMNQDDLERRKTLELILRLVRESRSHFLLLRKMHATSDRDFVTGAYLQRSYLERVEQEISRARRIEKPVSLGVVAVDRFSELVEIYGVHRCDRVLNAISGLIRRMSRNNDVIVRTGPGEFSVVLPHTDLKGGAVKFERIRRAIEKSNLASLLDNQIQGVRVNIGVSNYPDLSQDAESLIRTAQSALDQVTNSQEQKTCLATGEVNLKDI